MHAHPGADLHVLLQEMQLSPQAQPNVHTRQQLELGPGPGLGPPSLPQPTNSSANTINLAMAAIVAGSASARN